MEHSFLYGPVNRLLVSLLGAPPVASLSPGWRTFLFPDGDRIWLQDNVIMALALFAALAVTLPLAGRAFRKRSPNWFQNANEMIILAVRDLIDDVVGHGAGKKYLPLLGAFTYFILLSNLMGFFFFLTPPTASFQTTLALALVSFFYFNAQGIREHGVFGYLKHFMGPIIGLAPLLFVVEMVSVVVRIGSLSLRLVGNISGEHLATGIFFGMVPILVPWPMMLLGLIGALLQTFIFVILSTIYIAGAVAHEEH
ncbi:MAG TPA: F0F1 ATP synthase subunit A [Thermoanaerobaculia bacterium]|nr:F0F1 ATP synthase subunit A [Thermoanaerobaculia bacterium]